jgi:hypothetical protein
MKAFFSIILAFAISIGTSIGTVEAGPLRKAKYVAKSTVQKAKYVGHRVVKGTRKVVHTAVDTVTP